MTPGVIAVFPPTTILSTCIIMTPGVIIILLRESRPQELEWRPDNHVLSPLATTQTVISSADH